MYTKRVDNPENHFDFELSVDYHLPFPARLLFWEKNRVVKNESFTGFIGGFIWTIRVSLSIILYHYHSIVLSNQQLELFHYLLLHVPYYFAISDLNLTRPFIREALAYAISFACSSVSPLPRTPIALLPVVRISPSFSYTDA